MTDLLQRIERNIQNRDLFKRGGKILVAVSGGLDSMTLLHALEKLSARHRWQLVIAHFNHRLRGRASDTDERLVRKTAAALELPIVVERAAVKLFAKKTKLSIEMAARELRHDFLARVANRRKIKTIALAHHADDQVELFFLRLLRGAGGDGLAGMKWRSPSPAGKTIVLVRPLLDFSKGELAEFAHESKIQFRDDATNHSSYFLRNRIRNELLPLLRKGYQPGLDKAVLRLMEIVGAESEFAGEAARQWLASIKRAPHPVRRGRVGRRPGEGNDFEKLPVAIQRRIVRVQLAELGVMPDFGLVESLRQSADCSVSAGPNMSVARDAGGNVILRAKPVPQFSGNEQIVELGRAGEATFGNRKFRWRLQLQNKMVLPPQRDGVEFFNADKIGGGIVLRHWRAGDRFQPIGLKSEAKLQDLFMNAKISVARRRGLVLAATATGEIFWVEGLRIGERFKLTPETARKLVWRWSNLPV